MKASLVIICLFLIAAAAAQPRINCPALTDSSLNYLFIGVDNPIELVDLKIPAENVVISISGGGGSITKVGPYKYVVRVTTVTDHVLINISNKTKLLFSEQFKVRTIGERKYNWESGSTTKKDSLLKYQFLSLTIPGCYFKLNYEILSYEASIGNNDFIDTYTITGNFFSAALVRRLYTKNNDTILTFDNIRVKGPDGRSHRSPFIVLYLE